MSEVSVRPFNFSELNHCECTSFKISKIATWSFIHSWIKALLESGYNIWQKKFHMLRIARTASMIATLGSILDSQLSWESGKYQLARWSHKVEIFPERKPHCQPSTHPPTHPTIWISELFFVSGPHEESMCGIPPPSKGFFCAVSLSVALPAKLVFIA